MPQQTLSIDPTSTSGVDLATLLNNFASSVYTNSMGTSEPSYKDEGMFWMDNSGSAYTLKLYKGGAWRTLFSLNSSNVISFSGTPTVASQTEVNTGTDTTKMVVPATLSGMPAFRALQGSNLSLSSGVAAKINFSTIDWQVGSYYNTSLYRYTPPAGYYCVSVGGYLTGSVTYDAFLRIYVNGSQYAQTLSAGNNGGSAAQLCLTDLIYLNGTDYIEAYAAVSLASGGTCSVVMSNGFSAFKIR